jgi:hypothetical protein
LLADRLRIADRPEIARSRIEGVSHGIEVVGEQMRITVRLELARDEAGGLVHQSGAEV